MENYYEALADFYSNIREVDVNFMLDFITVIGGRLGVWTHKDGILRLAELMVNGVVPLRIFIISVIPN